MVKQSWTSAKLISRGESPAILYAISPARLTAGNVVISSFSSSATTSDVYETPSTRTGFSVNSPARSRGAMTAAAAPSLTREQSYTVSESVFAIAINASPFLLPLMFQVTFEMSAFQSGLLVLAMFAGNVGMKSMTSRVLRRFGFRNVLLANGIITAALLLACGFLTPQTPKTVIVAVLFLHGLSRSMQGTGITTLAFADIPTLLMGSATSFSAITQQMAMGMGMALGAIALRTSAWMHSRPAGILSVMDFHVAF